MSYEFFDLRQRDFPVRCRMPLTEPDSSPIELARTVAILGPFSPYDLQHRHLTGPLFRALARQLFHYRNYVRFQLGELGWNPRALSMWCRPAPGFVVAGTKLLSCSLPTWCPFCWARGTVDSVFAKLERAVRDRPRENRKLVFREWSRLFPADQPLADVFAFPIPKLRTAGVRLTLVEPCPEGWLLSCRTLQLPEAVKGLAGGPPAGLTDVASRVKLARLTGRFCRYPVGLLTADPQRVRLLLEQRQGRRLLTSYGAFRNGPKTCAGPADLWTTAGASG